MLVVVIAGALMAMQQYVYRAMNARLKDVQEELSSQYARDNRD